MNPIIFIDELDKVSHTEHGREIISILTHLTDSTQNDEFEDKFFSGIKLDLSKALIIFSFNDISLIDNVLKDRITVIETHPLKLTEKITIIKDYMLPEITKEIGFGTDEIIIEDNLIKYLIETYTLEPGVRKIKEKIIEIDSKILFEDINLITYNHLMKLSPFGSGNAYPIFSCKKMKVVEIQTLTNGKHLKMKLSNGDKQWILAKAWRKGYLADRISIGDFIDVAFNLEIDTWMNRNNLSLNIIDIQIK